MIDLSKIHTLPREGGSMPYCPAVHAAFKLAQEDYCADSEAGMPPAWTKWLKGKRPKAAIFRAQPEYLAFIKCYRRWVADVRTQPICMSTDCVIVGISEMTLGLHHMLPDNL